MSDKADILETMIARELDISRNQEVRLKGASVKQHDGGRLAEMIVEVGHMVTESMIEADFYNEHFEPDDKYKVVFEYNTGELKEIKEKMS